MKFATLLLAITAATIGGPALAEPAVAPTPEAAEAAIRSRLESYMSDPSSAQLKIERGPMMGQVTTKQGAYDGWLVCAQLNGKNRYGGYIGFERYLFILPKDGGEVVVLPRLTKDYGNVDAWRAACYVDPPEARTPAAI